MLVDRKIYTKTNGNDIKFEFSESLYNNIYFSLNVPRGTIEKDFGSKLYLIKKINENSIQNAILYIKEALQWLIDYDRVSSITANVRQNAINQSRLDIEINCVKIKNEIQYTLFYDVV